MPNVIREDVVKVGFDIDLKTFTQLQKDVDELKKKLTGNMGGDALDDLKRNANGAKSGMDKAKQSANKLGSSLTSLGKKAAVTAYNGLKKVAGISFKALTVGIGAASAAIGGIVTKSVQAYADYEQFVGGVDTLFKDSSGIVQKYANDAYKTAGLSANEYMETVTSFSASLLQSLGGDTKKAAEYADLAISDMADNSNKMGTDMSSIQYAYQGFAKQNYTMLDNLKLGYGGTKEEMKRLIQDAAKLDKSIDANSMSYGNIVKAIHAVQVELDIYGTTQKEAEHTITGSLNSMKSAWGNLLPALIQGGESFDQCVKNLVDSVKIFARNIKPAIKQALSGVGSLIEELTPIIVEEIPTLVDELLPPLIKAATQIVAGLIKALPSIISALAKEVPGILKTLGQTIMETFGDQYPIVKKFADAFNKMGEFCQKNVGNIKQIIPVLLGIAGALIAIKKVKSIGSALSGLFGKKSGEKSGGGFLSGIANMKTTKVLKAVTNITIIVGAFALLIGIANEVFKDGVDFKGLLQVIVLIGILGVIGTALAKLAGIAGKIRVTTVLKGLANIAIIVTGLGALLWLATKAFKNGVDFKEMLEVIALIGILGTVGSILSVFAGVVGLIPFTVVLKGLANIALVLAGFTAIIAAFGALSMIPGFNDFLEKGGEVLAKITNILGDMIGSFIGGIGEGITNSLPAIGQNIADFAENLKPAFEIFNGVDLGGVGDFLAAMGAFFLTMAGEKLLSFFTGKTSLADIGTDLSNFAENAKVFFDELGGNTDFSTLTNLFNALSSIKELPKSGGFAQFFTGDPYAGLKQLIMMMPSMGTSIAEFFNNLGDRTNFSAIPNLFNALASVKELPKTGGFAQFFTGDPYAGLKQLISMMPILGVSVTAFYKTLGDRTDFSAIPNLFNALASVKELPKSGGFAQFFNGDPYIGLKQLIKMMPILGVSITAFYKTLGDRTDFSAIPNLFNALASVKELPKSGGFAQFFTGDPYVGLKQLISMMPILGVSITAFYKTLGDRTDFSAIPNLFNALSSVKELPKSGGFAQFFTGDPYKALKKMVELLPSLGLSTQTFFASISGIDDFSKMSELFKAIGSLSDYVDSEGGFFDKIGKAFSGDEKTALESIGESLGTFGTNTKEFFANVNKLNLSNLNGLWESLEKASNISGDVLIKVDDNISDIVSKVSKLPNKMADGIKKSGDSLSTALVSIWKDAVKDSAKPINKLIEGANWILKEFGSDKKIVAWEPYAKGTNGHKGGNALVNDGRGAELVQMPNGNTFIPKGRNVLLPNAPKGMKVLPAGKTAKLMGRKSPTFHYAEGTGNIDIWNYIDDANGLVKQISDGIKYSGKGVVTHIAKGMVSTVTGQMSAWVDKLFEEMGGMSIEGYNPSKGVSQWKSTVIRALKMEGQYSAANLSRTLMQMQTESGGNPKAINLWDSNAKKGIPSKGLMQVIDPTFKAYARPGFDKNIYDPLSNILASIRYATSRYGSLSKAYRGVGYSNGTGTLKIASYSPESSADGSGYGRNEYNTYSPQFTLNISGSSDDRETARKVKRWIKEAIDETFDSMARKNPRLQEI